MKYYVMKNKKMEGYLSRELCRIHKNGLFEVYDYKDKSNSEWIMNETVEKLFKSKSDDFDIYEPDKNEIIEIKNERDDNAYEMYHTHVSVSGGHREFIYQDLRMVDGYIAEDGFDYNEIYNRDSYIYYKNNDLLFKKDKKTNEFFVLEVIDKINYYDKNWVKLDDKTDTNKLELIRDFDDVLKMCNSYSTIIDEFDYLERTNKNNYDYYSNKDNDLIRKNKNNKEIDIFMIGMFLDNRIFSKNWINIKNIDEEIAKIDLDSLKMIKDFNEVLKYIDKKYKEEVDDFNRLKDGIDIKWNDRFEILETFDREAYEYFYDNVEDIIIKKNKETNEYFILGIGINRKDDYIRAWFGIEEYFSDNKDYDFSNLKLIKDFNKVIKFSRELLEDAYNE